MKQSILDLKTSVESTLGDDLVDSKIALDEFTIEVKPGTALENFKSLRDELAFEQLIDITAVDYLDFGQANWETMSAPNKGFSRGVFDFSDETEGEDSKSMVRRYAVVYHLLSVSNNVRLRVKVFPDSTDLPIVDSVIDVWNVANWFEREAFDMYGVLFKGHPDLRRILTDYGFVGHPLRKDFPLTGTVETRYDAEKARVVYEPVSIENRVNVPRVIRTYKDTPSEA